MTHYREAFQMTRRGFLAAAAGTAVAFAAGKAPTLLTGDPSLMKNVIKNGRIRQATCMGVARASLKEAAPIFKKLGLLGVDLQGPDAFPTLKENGLICTLVRGGHGLAEGLIRPDSHAKFLPLLRENIEAASAAGYANVIVLSGNRNGMPDEEGAKNLAVALKQVAKFAEEKKVTLCIELLNSKVDHPDYMADSTEWGVKVCKAVGSPSVKLLFDIYHMGVMGEDVLAMINKHHEYFGHYHTAGIPGRHEIHCDPPVDGPRVKKHIENTGYKAPTCVVDGTTYIKQQLDYPTIMKAIVATGYKGYVSHEYSPLKDPLTSLIAAMQLCDV